MQLWAVTDASLPPAERALLPTLAPEQRRIYTDHPELIRGYTVLPDLSGQPGLLLRADLPRTISQKGIVAARVAAAMSLAGAIAVLFTTWFGLRAAVVRPLARLTAHAVRVGTDGDLRARLDLDSSDELGVLAREFDGMVARLAASQRAALDSAHHAGEAAVAIEMLHNVGNVLTSVTVATGLLSEQVQATPASDVGKLKRLFDQHAADLGGFMAKDGDRVLAYLTALTADLEAGRERTARDVERVAAGVTHIRHILASQEARSRMAGLREDVTGTELVADALRIHAAAFEQRRVRLSRVGGCEVRCKLDRHRVLQVLSNLLKNALDCVSEGGQVEINVYRPEPGRLRISVRDNGIGIAHEDMVRIFAPGYTTRTGGTGIGLHSAANMARELGGTLTAESAGLGGGATFALDVPAPAALA